MADALMLYETIDADQIDDIMSGRPPREPADWGGSDGGAPAGSRSSKTAEDADEAASPIGGPAGEH
jgi:cell division protease FtsH